MKTLKILSIIGLVIAALGIMAFYVIDWSSYVEDAEAIAGWVMILALWLIAQSVTTLVQVKNHKE